MSMIRLYYWGGVAEIGRSKRDFTDDEIAFHMRRLRPTCPFLGRPAIGESGLVRLDYGLDAEFSDELARLKVEKKGAADECVS